MPDSIQQIRILAAAAARNGKISGPEEAVVRRVARGIQVADDDVSRVLKEDLRSRSIASLLPAKPAKRKKMFAHLTELAGADGVVTPQEMGLLQALAGPCGVSADELAAILERSKGRGRRAVATAEPARERDLPAEAHVRALAMTLVIAPVLSLILVARVDPALLPFAGGVAAVFVLVGWRLAALSQAARWITVLLIGWGIWSTYAELIQAHTGRLLKFAGWAGLAVEILFLWVLWNGKSWTLFTPEYRDAVASRPTPGPVVAQSFVFWVFVVSALLGFLLGMLR